MGTHFLALQFLEAVREETCAAEQERFVVLSRDDVAHVVHTACRV